MTAGKRDYSLTGPDAQAAVEKSLTSAKWYRTKIPRQYLKALMQRRDGPAVRDTLLWLGLLIGFATTAVMLWPSVWAIPFFLAYGVLYGSAGDSRWHECGHSTAFKTEWMNEVVYQIGSFMMMRNPMTWRWSHKRHHSDTLIVGRDPEIQAMRPPNLLRIGLNYFGVMDVIQALKTMVVNTFGILDAGEASFIPGHEQPKVFLAARIWMAIYLTTLALALYLGSIVPLLLIGLPRLYGAWHHVLTGLLQHGGLADNTLDHRLNSRTVYINPVSRFIYWNMNYHVEHHMFPLVPYYNLPKLHELLKHDLPAPNASILDGYREIWPVLKRQLRNNEHFLKRKLPATAQPYQSAVRGNVDSQSVAV